MIKLRITDTPFMNVPTVEADQWMNDNVGELLHDEFGESFGNGWKIYMQEDKEAEDFRCWYVEFEDEKHATMFLLRWS